MIVASLVAYVSMKLSSDSSYLSRSRDAWFIIEDASGLVKNSAVKMAGINIGVIRAIKLQDHKARVEMTLQPDIRITTSSAIKVRATGILGDKFVEIIPGNPNDPVILDGGQITIVVDAGSMDTLITQIGTVVDTVKKAVTEEGNTKDTLGRVIRNIENLTKNLADITGDNKGEIRDVVKNLKNITEKLDGVLNGKGEEGFDNTWKQVRGSLAKLDKSLDNLQAITDKVRKGEGTIGKLINDEQTVDELNSAIEGVNNYLDTAKKMQTSIDFQTAYMANTNGYRSALGIQIQPGLDRYYDIQIVDDPKGVESVTNTNTQNSQTGSSVNHETKTEMNKVKFTVMFAKNFFNFTLKGGLIENTGGVGVDYSVFRQRLKFSLEAFDFGHMNLRPSARYNFFKGIYVVGGVDDALDKRSSYSTYLGAGIFLTNDDLKALMSKVSF